MLGLVWGALTPVLIPVCPQLHRVSQPPGRGILGKWHHPNSRNSAPKKIKTTPCAVGWSAWGQSHMQMGYGREAKPGALAGLSIDTTVFL